MKPECIEHQKQIARALLGDLPGEERQSLEAHLADCPDCRLEQKSYGKTLQLLRSAGDEPVPRHFFVFPEEKNLTPWAVFRLMKPQWQALTLAIAGLVLIAGIGTVTSFTRRKVDVAALRMEILKSAEQNNREAMAKWSQDMRAEIAGSRTDLIQQQKAELSAAMARLDSRLTGRVNAAEGRVLDETKKTAVDIYRTISQDRARDLSFINFRFDSIEAGNAIETRQTDAILDTLLQAAELRIK